jgi:hypothetical protein
MRSVISLEERRKQLQRAKIIAELEAQTNAACAPGRIRPKYFPNLLDWRPNDYP